MHPLAHMLTGALIGQIAPNPAVAAVGGLLSHGVLDFIPHTEGETFRVRETSLIRPDLLEAGVETIVGTVLLWRIASGCAAANVEQVAIGALAGMLPDLIDIPLKQLFGVTLLHIHRLHWTVRRQHAVWGILTQVITAGGATLVLWLTACR